MGKTKKTKSKTTTETTKETIEKNKYIINSFNSHY